MSGIEITERMSVKAKEWTNKKMPHIVQHFIQKRIGKQESIYMSMLGEIAFCDMMDIDWINMKRDFAKPDIDAITNKGARVEVKTYSVPSPYFEKLVTNRLENDDLYGMCLINGNQTFELKVCDFVFFGVFPEYDYSFWYPIGYMSTKQIRENYSVQSTICNGRIVLPQPAIAIGNQDVKKIKKWYNIE